MRRHENVETWPSYGIKATTPLALQTHIRMSMTYCQICTDENVEPWPQAQSNCDMQQRQPNFPCIWVNIYTWHMIVSIGTKMSKRDHMPTINSRMPQRKTKLANCLEVASAPCMCFCCCCCASHTQSSWPVVVLEVRKHSQIHVKMMSSRTIRGWLIVLGLSSQSR